MVRNHMMHELGLRILIRKIQLQGAQFDKALIPCLRITKTIISGFISGASREKRNAMKCLSSTDIYC